MRLAVHVAPPTRDHLAQEYAALVHQIAYKLARRLPSLPIAI